MVVDQRDFLQRNRLLSHGRLRIRLSLADGKHHIQHHLRRQWRIYNSISGGGREPAAQFLLDSSLPVTFNNLAIVPFGGTEMRFLLFMDGSLYAGIGNWEDPLLQNPQTPGAQVLRLDSANGSWVEDQDFNQVQPSSGEKFYQAIAGLGTAHFDQDSGNNPITPVDVLMAGFYNLDIGGVSVAQKTVTTNPVGAQGTLTITSSLVPLPAAAGQVRSFASYTNL